MRTMLMAATAMFSASMIASHAQAQMPAQPVTTDSFTPGLVLSGANPPPPGSVTVTLRLRDYTDLGYGSDSGTVAKGTNGQPNGYKQQNFQILNFIRLYPRLAGTAANGLLYGAQVQLRQNSGAGGSTGGNTLYVRQAGAYIGLPTLGTLWTGQVSGALTQFLVGTQEDWDAGNGGWNGDSPYLLSAGTVVSWLWPDAGGTYTSNKIVYISPKFAGFDFGVSFEPSYSTGAAGANSNSQATSGGSILSSAPGGLAVRRNTYDLAARYTGSFGPVAAVLEGGYWGSGVVNNSTGPNLYKGLSVVDLGAKFVINNLEIGAHYDFGTISTSGYQPLRAGEHKESAFIGGAEYKIGQGIVGIQYINSISGGTYVAQSPGNGLHETGVALGGSYAYAPGAEAYLSILYGVRHQSGADLLNGVAGANNNTTTARAIGIGNRFNF